MQRARILTALLIVATTIPALASSTHPARAAGGIGGASTDFTRITPRNAILYSAFQATAVDQQTNVATLEKIITTQPGVQSLLAGASTRKSAATSSTMTSALLTNLRNGLHTIFTGELGLAVLPVTTATNANGKVHPQIHAILGAGLQPGVTPKSLADALSLLPLTPLSDSYQGIAISSLDLSVVESMLGMNAKQAAGMANGPIASTVYTAVLGNDAVVGTDLPSLKAAIDAYTGQGLSITGNSDFQSTTATLPDARLLTVYYHYDLGDTISLVKALGAHATSTTGASGTYSQAFAVTAKPDGILGTASPSVRTGTLANSVDLGSTRNSAAGLQPGNALFYADLNDPGALIRQVLDQRKLLIGQSSMPIKTLDPEKLFNRVFGLNLNDDVLSQLHGEASLAILPMGSSTAASPAGRRLSLVATVKVADPAAAASTLGKIDATLQDLSYDPNPLKLVQTAGPSNTVQQILAGTSNGIGYTFKNGYLIAATALPAASGALVGVGTTTSLNANPLYQSALRYAGSGSQGAVLFADLSGLRQVGEQIAQDSGRNLTRYDQSERPLLTAYKSLVAVANSGANGGGVVFLGIGQ